MRKPPLILIALDRRAPWSAVHSQLTQLGYPVEVADRRLVPGEGAECNWKIVVCLLGTDSFGESRNSTLDTLARFGGCPRMGLIVGECPTRDFQLVSYCNEFSVWPCSEDELDARLLRLDVSSVVRRGEPTPTMQDILDLNLVGANPYFLETVARIKRFARCDAPVLIEGETGTGKELAARAVHYLSDRRDQPFIPVNCGAIPDSLMENEFFGHDKGAFTDAGRAQTGLIAQADKGSLFLDEVATLSPKAQVVLLRFLQEMEYRPLGSRRTVHADLRVIAASNIPLQDLVRSGNFRQDLWFRLNIMPVRVPSLRERFDDVPLLAEHFLAGLRRHYGQSDKYLHPSSLHRMCSYDWPGNIRELENVVHRAFLLSEGAVVSVESLGMPQPEFDGSLLPAISGGFNEAKSRAIDTFERDYLTRLLQQCSGNVSEAARHAGKERRALGKLLKKHGIDRRVFR